VADRPVIVIVDDEPTGLAGMLDALSRRFDAYGRTLPEAPPQPAQTRYRRLATIELSVAIDRYPSSRYALVELSPLTGRQHQLRRHMKHIAHPIIGDATHGKGRHNRYFQQEFGCGRLLLACTRLAFRHPVSGEKIGVGATVKDQFAELLERFDWSYSPESGDATRSIAS